jgi:septal ring factor EnvC (AmiA/AmiB activator)
MSTIEQRIANAEKNHDRLMAEAKECRRVIKADVKVLAKKLTALEARVEVWQTEVAAESQNVARLVKALAALPQGGEFDELSEQASGIYASLLDLSTRINP